MKGRWRGVRVRWRRRKDFMVVVGGGFCCGVVDLSFAIPVEAHASAF